LNKAAFDFEGNHKPMNVAEKRVWITGASSGIGEALAYAFHRAGARVILSARREDELKRVQSQCGAAHLDKNEPRRVSASSDSLANRGP